MRRYSRESAEAYSALSFFVIHYYGCDSVQRMLADIDLRPFFSFYGSKWRVSNRYSAPRFNTIVEPFAGSAGYSLRHSNRKIILNDLDPVVYRIWRDLIRANADDVRSMPPNWEGIISMDESGLRDMARFWLNKGASVPSNSPSSWMIDGRWGTQFWGNSKRDLIASQVEAINHWEVTNLSYRDIDVDSIGEATWFIDPPYQGAAGRSYKQHKIDFSELADWCKSLRGQVIVCEQHGADWLDFMPFMNAKSRRGFSREVVWMNDAVSPFCPA